MSGDDVKFYTIAANFTNIEYAIKVLSQSYLTIALYTFRKGKGITTNRELVYVLRVKVKVLM